MSYIVSTLYRIETVVCHFFTATVCFIALHHCVPCNNEVGRSRVGSYITYSRPRLGKVPTHGGPFLLYQIYLSHPSRASVPIVMLLYSGLLQPNIVPTKALII